jgi:predicted DNA-binding transcriptional regulator AlpA
MGIAFAPARQQVNMILFGSLKYPSVLLFLTLIKGQSSVSMKSKVNGKAEQLSLFPGLEEQEFWDKFRVVVREEVKRKEPGATAPGKLQVDGLTQMPLYNMDDVRKLFRGVSRSTIYEWIDRGLLKPVKLRGRVYFLWKDIEDLWKS